MNKILLDLFAQHQELVLGVLLLVALLVAVVFSFDFDPESSRKVKQWEEQHQTSTSGRLNRRRNEARLILDDAEISASVGLG